MSYATVTKVDATRIPVIDISPLFCDQPDYGLVGDQLQLAARQSGFFYVRNHCIDEIRTAQAFAISAEFFASSDMQKKSVAITPYHRGLLQVGQSRMEGQARADLKESYLWGLDVAPDNADFLHGNVMLPPNNWPDFMPHMRSVLNGYMDAAHRCGKQLLRAIAVSLDIDRDYFVSHFDKPISRGSLIHYPPQSEDMGLDQYGVSPHTDYGTMTLLAQDNTGGLRVRDNHGKWITAHPIEGTLVVNVGDLLARWSNDRFSSTEHAVVNTAGRERYSIAIALDPDWHTPIRPVVTADETPRYDEVRCGDYIQGRFNRSFNYRQQSLQTPNS